MDDAQKRTWAEIDLGRLARNYHALRGLTPPGCKFLGVVKANAYGQGAVPVAKKLEELGPRIFLAGAKYVVDVLFASLVAQKGLKDVSQRDNWLKLHFQY